MLKFSVKVVLFTFLTTMLLIVASLFVSCANYDSPFYRCYWARDSVQVDSTWQKDSTQKCPKTNPL